MPPDDPLFGNDVSALIRSAIDPASRVPTGDPRFWQPPTPEELQARLGGGYVIEAFLARGGMGAVYRGIQASLERHVAIKILPPLLQDHDSSFAQRFKQEARAMAQLNHPGIVSVYDSGEMADGTLYFIMEYIDGTDVAHMVASQGRLSSAHAMAITAHVCDALQYAHENGVVHRDIKPANIMVGNDGRVKVADFGLAKSSRVTQSSLTMTGHVMGTPHFVAPEALTLGANVDHRADIYAVGVMLYQMLTGKLPQGIFEMPSLLIPGLDPRYDAIIAAAMREDRAARYQAIHDMRRALDAILTQPVAKSQATPRQSAPAKPLPEQAYRRPPQTAKPAATPKPKSNTSYWLLAAGVMLSFGGMAWMKMLTSHPDPLLTATKDKPFTNSLGMSFIPLPGTKVLMCQHETRRKDYEAFAKENHGIDNSWQDQKFNGWPAGHQDDHPVVGVSWNEAKAFCAWLSKKEGRNFRLPTDREWSQAAGIGKKEAWKENEPPAAINAKVKEYTWGVQFPPTTEAKDGNYGDITYHEKQPNESFIAGYNDGFSSTAPVMEFKANGFGFHDIGGNAREWVEDWWDAAKTQKILRGSAWHSCFHNQMHTSSRHPQNENHRDVDTGFRCVIEAPVAFPEVEFLIPPSTEVSHQVIAQSNATPPDSTRIIAADPPKPPVATSSTAPAGSHPSDASVSLPGEIRLEFKNADKFYDVGGFQPSELPMSTKVPRSIVKAPVDLGPALYGELVLGPKARQRTHAVIVSHPKTPQSRLFIDRNANGDLTDDPPVSWQPAKQSNIATKEQWEVFQGEFMADLPCDDGVHPARFEVFQNTSAQGAFDRLWIHPQYGRIGLVELDDGRNYKVLLYDDGAVGDFSAASSTLRIDLTGEGGFRKENKEVFPVLQPFEIKGVTYQLRGLTPSGDNFILVPGSNTPPASVSDSRTFTDREGRQIQATLIRVQNDDVTLKREDGREFTLKAATLSDPDINYLKTQGLVLPATGQPPAAPAGPAALATLWKNRCTAAERLEVMRRMGGSPHVETSVSAALHELKWKQNRDGSWGGEGRCGKTALALLAYLGRCETMESKDFSDSITKGTIFLIESAKKNTSGILAAEAASPDADAEHAMATGALAQMYLAARSGTKSLPGMRETFENGIRLIIQSQTTTSARESPSLLTLAWQAEALNTARLTRLKFDGLSDGMSRLALLIKQAQKPDGSFSGQAAETPPIITGACVRALQILPGDHQAAIAKGIQFVRQHHQKDPLDRARMDLHAVFFQTRAFFRQGGDDWKFWNQQMLPQLLAAQQPDGSFSCPPSLLLRGDSLDTTALAALTLETYFWDSSQSE